MTCCFCVGGVLISGHKAGGPVHLLPYHYQSSHAACSFLSVF